MTIVQPANVKENQLKTIQYHTSSNNSTHQLKHSMTLSPTTVDNRATSSQKLDKSFGHVNPKQTSVVMSASNSLAFEISHDQMSAASEIVSR
jgi:hypothetical protein